MDYRYKKLLQVIPWNFIKGHYIQTPANRSPHALTMSEVNETVHFKSKIFSNFTQIRK